MASQLESVCTNPPVPTQDKIVARCALCAKPLSAATIYREGGAAFCGKAAAEQHRISNQRMEGLDKKGSGLVGLLIKLIVIGAIAAGGWYGYQYWKSNKASIDKTLKDKIQQSQESLTDLSNKAEKAVEAK